MNTSQALNMFNLKNLKDRVTKLKPGKNLRTTLQNTITAVRNYAKNTRPPRASMAKLLSSRFS